MNDGLLAPLKSDAIANGLIEESELFIIPLDEEEDEEEEEEEEEE